MTSFEETKLDRDTHPIVYAELIKQKYHFKTLKKTHQILFYKDGAYEEGGGDVIMAELQDLAGKNCSRHLVSEVMGHIERKTLIDKSEFDTENKFCLANGILDLNTFTVTEHVPEYLTRIKSGVIYDETKECSKFDKFLEEIVPDEFARTCLLEDIASCFIKDASHGKADILIGNGGNGKSTLLKFISIFFGQKNVSNRPLYELETDKFARADLDGKLISITHDNTDLELKHCSILKTIIDGGEISCQRKHQDAYDMFPFTKFFIACNKLFTINDFSDGMMRRWNIYEFNQSFLDGNANTNLLEEITAPDELSGFLNKMIEVLKGIKKHGYTPLATVEQNRLKWQNHSDPISEYCNSEIKVDPAEKVQKTEALYPDYLRFCRQKNYVSIKETPFFKRVLEIFPMIKTEKLAGKNHYIGIGIKNPPKEDQTTL